MDGTEPYTGHEDYDPGMSDSTMPDDFYDTDGSTSTTAVQETEPPVTITAQTIDTNRYFEVDLLGDGFTLPDKYSDQPSGHGEIPLTAVYSDTGRVSIFPLVITAKPPGVEKTCWRQMDADGIYPRTYESALVGEEVLSVHAEKTGELQKAVSSGGSGGNGGEITEEAEEHDPTEMPFLDHLEEFRWALLKSIFTIVIGMLLSWFMAEKFITTITRLAEGAELNLVYIKILGPIMLRLQTALFMGLVISIPFIFYFMWSFVSPGLYKREKKWILPGVIGATVCFFIGASIAYFIIIPFILKFIKVLMVKGLLGMFEVNDFILWMLKFTVLFGVLFEMPMVSYYLAKIGILKYYWMTKYRKYAIVIIFIAGAILTPPDPLSQIMMAIPLIMLYEISIQVARVAGKKTLL